MFNQAQFRQFADECIAWARTTSSECERQQFLDMAKLWMTAARQLDDRHECQIAFAREGEEQTRAASSNA